MKKEKPARQKRVVWKELQEQIRTALPDYEDTGQLSLPLEGGDSA